MSHTTSAIFSPSNIKDETIKSPTKLLKKKAENISDDYRSLVKACVRNERTAQKKLYDLFCDEMYTIARFIVKDPDMAKDVIQLSFINVFNKIGSLKDPLRLKYWIKTIVTREAIYHNRKEMKFKNIEDADFEDYEWPDDMSGDYLQEAILMLDEGYRAVFVLIEVEGYSHQEVAGALNISEGTSKSQLFHAKKKLKKIIRELLIVNIL